MTDPIAFAASVLLVLITPGPTNTLLMTSGAANGVRRSLSLLAAELVGYNVGIVATATAVDALGAVIRRPDAWLKVAAAAYLCFLAVRLWSRAAEAKRAAVLPREVLITTLLNPKVLIFALVIIPVRDPHAWRYLAAFSLLLLMAGTSWVVVGATASRLLADRLVRLIPRMSAAALAVFAVLLVWVGVLRDA